MWCINNPEIFLKREKETIKYYSGILRDYKLSIKLDLLQIESGYMKRASRSSDFSNFD